MPPRRPRVAAPHYFRYGAPPLSLTDDRGNEYQGVNPLRDHPYVAHPWGEAVIGVTAMPDDSMWPLFAPGQLVFYARAAHTTDRPLVVRFRGRTLVRFVWWRPNGYTLTSTGGDGAILALPKGWKRDERSGMIHPELEVLGVAVKCRATYAAYVTAYSLLSGDGRTPERAAVHRVMYGGTGNLMPLPARCGEGVPPLFVGFAN